LIGLLLAVGCQSTVRTQPTAAALIPPPCFDGPRLAPPGSPGTHSYAAAPSGPSSWVPQVAPRPWKWIVIHHSASPTGSMAVFDKEHRAKGWDGVGYHFVIGNGTNSGDGQVEVTPRWPIQKWGAHAKTLDNRYNEFGIGICLVGNFDSTRPTARQMASLDKLVAYLMQTYHISPQNVIGHRDTKPTECPGRNMDVAAVRQTVTRIIAEAGNKVDGDEAKVAKLELLGDISR
jgi:hypothetical protein